MKKVLKQIEEKYTHHIDYDEMVESINGFTLNIIGLAKRFLDKNDLNDEDIAIQLFRLKSNSLSNPLYIRFMACVISDKRYLNDRKWAKELYERAFDKKEMYDDYSAVDGSNIKDFDEYISISSFKKQTVQADITNHIYALVIANSAINYLDDKEWAKLIYQKAIDLCTSDEERQDIIPDIKDKLKDTKWDLELYKKYNITQTTKIYISAKEVIYYAEIKKIKDVNTQEKLKIYLNELNGTSSGAGSSFLLTNDAKYEHEEDNNSIDVKLEESYIALTDEMKEDEVIFVVILSFGDSSSRTIMINNDIPLTLITVKIGHLNIIDNYIQDEEELSPEFNYMSMHTNNDEDEGFHFIGVILNPKENIKMIDEFKLCDEYDDDDEIVEEKLSEGILGFLQDKLKNM